jgi:hypothetical protein
MNRAAVSFMTASHRAFRMRTQIDEHSLLTPGEWFRFVGNAKVWWLAVALGFSSCVTPLSYLTREQKTLTPQAGYLLHLAPTEPEAEIARISNVLSAVTLPFSRWGSPSHRIDVFVMPSHQDL